MRTFLLLALGVSLVSCTSLVLKPVEYAWPVERVLQTDGNGQVRDDRYMISVNMKPLLYEETQDSLNVYGKSIRIIRDVGGHYYMTAKGFKHVYVFATSEGSLSLRNKIAVSETGLRDPAFNQRRPYVQLLNGSDKPKMLTPNGIEEGGQR
jgi:hypothetical protein